MQVEYDYCTVCGSHTYVLPLVDRIDAILDEEETAINWVCKHCIDNMFVEVIDGL